VIDTIDKMIADYKYAYLIFGGHWTLNAGVGASVDLHECIDK
jgi:hypothetical protein